MEPQYGVGQCPCQMRAWIAAQEGQHTPSLKKPDTLLSDKYVAISNSAGYCDKILYACSPQDNRAAAAGGSARSPRHVCLTPVCPACLLDHLIGQEEQGGRHRHPQ